MALTVELGNITAGANSYVAIADADAYHSDRLNAAWTAASTAQKTAALINATAYLDGKYRKRWQGVRISSLQPLEWPRVLASPALSSIYDGFVTIHETLSTVVPEEIKSATCELALRALSSPLAPDVAPSARVKRKKVDVIETEYVTGDFQTSYPVVDQLVSRYLRSGNDAVRG